MTGLPPVLRRSAASRQPPDAGRPPRAARRPPSTHRRSSCRNCMTNDAADESAEVPSAQTRPYSAPLIWNDSCIPLRVLGRPGRVAASRGIARIRMRRTLIRPSAGVLLATCLLLPAADAAAQAQLRSVSYVTGLSAPVGMVQDPSDPAIQYDRPAGGAHPRHPERGAPVDSFHRPDRREPRRRRARSARPRLPVRLRAQRSLLRELHD